jgi:YbbR domain-containing protein
VPIEIIQVGSPPEGVTIDSITLDKKEATITGNEGILNTTRNVRVEVDVSKVNENMELTLPVIIPVELKGVSPEIVKATVKVSVALEETVTIEEEEATKTISNIPIQLNGLSENYLVTFQKPSNGRVDIAVTGKEEVLATITEADFELAVNVAELGEGEHELQINVSGPENVSSTVAIDKVAIVITEKEIS